MNGGDLRFLADRAETVVGRPDHRLAEVHARIASTRRRRAVAVAVTASTAVLATAVGFALLTGPAGSNRGNRPLPPADSRTTAHNPPAADATRRIVYGEGWPIRVVHIGDQTVDIGDLLPSGSDPPVYLNTTDDGVVVTVDTEAGRIWFTDGTDVVPIGRIGAYTHIGSSRVVTGTSGSLAAWPDRSRGSTQLVVYDTAQRLELTRIDCPRCGTPEVVGSHVYWAENEAVSSESTTRFDAETGETSRVPATAYAEDLAGRPRGLALGDPGATGGVTDGLGAGFAVRGGRLVALRTDDHLQPTEAVDTGSGTVLDLRLPRGYRTSRPEDVGEEVDYNALDWLDDDRLALVADSNPGDVGWQIVVCRISTGRCRLAVPPSLDRRWAANLDFP